MRAADALFDPDGEVSIMATVVYSRLIAAALVGFATLSQRFLFAQKELNVIRQA